MKSAISRNGTCAPGRQRITFAAKGYPTPAASPWAKVHRPEVTLLNAHKALGISAFERPERVTLSLAFSEDRAFTEGRRRRDDQRSE